MRPLCRIGSVAAHASTGASFLAAQVVFCREIAARGHAHFDAVHKSLPFFEHPGRFAWFSYLFAAPLALLPSTQTMREPIATSLFRARVYANSSRSRIFRTSFQSASHRSEEHTSELQSRLHLV